jgi:hypothetical protein
VPVDQVVGDGEQLAAVGDRVGRHLRLLRGVEQLVAEVLSVPTARFVAAAKRTVSVHTSQSGDPDSGQRRPPL